MKVIKRVNRINRKFVCKGRQFAGKDMKSKALVLMLALCLGLSACAGEAGGERTDSVKSEPAADGGEDGGAAGGAGEEAPASEDAVMEPEGPVEVGDDYRDFTAVLADGGSFTLSAHEGSVILINFWATWCGPCVREMPAFPMLIEKYGEDLTLLAVNVGETEESVQGFLEKNGYEFPVALDTEDEICNLYPSDGIPYTVLIGRDGKIASIHLGADTADAMYAVYCEEIDGLLEE